MDTYFVYIQIPMYKSNKEKMTFMAEQANYQYKVLSFDLKNVGATYQRMMNKVLKEEIDKKTGGVHGRHDC